MRVVFISIILSSNKKYYRIFIIILFKLCHIILPKSNTLRSTMMITMNIVMCSSQKMSPVKFPPRGSFCLRVSGGHWESSNREDGSTMRSIVLSHMFCYSEDLKALIPIQANHPQSSLLPLKITGDLIFELFWRQLL